MSAGDFLSRHSDWKNVYYDDDLRALNTQFKKCLDILKAITHRYERHETIQIAKSVFDYVTQKEMSLEYPHTRYCFACGDVKIFVKKLHLHNSRFYTVVSLGWLPHSRFNEYRNDHGYYLSETLESILTHYVDIVNDFTRTNLGALF